MIGFQFSGSVPVSCLRFSKVELLLRSVRMSACAFKRFPDFVLTDKGVLNSDSHKYVVANGIVTASAFSQSLGNIHGRTLVLFPRIIFKLHFKITKCRQFYKIFQFSIIWRIFQIKPKKSWSILQKFPVSLRQNIYQKTWIHYHRPDLQLIENRRVAIDR